MNTTIIIYVHLSVRRASCSHSSYYYDTSTWNINLFVKRHEKILGIKTFLKNLLSESKHLTMRTSLLEHSHHHNTMLHNMIYNLKLNTMENNRASQDSTLIPPREALVSWLSRLYGHRLTTTTGGNLSFIDDDGTLYITPSGGDKAIIHPSNVAIRKLGEDIFDGPMPPSIEYKLHTEVYKSRRSCRAILHAHSFNLVAFSIIGSNGVANSSDTAGSHPGVPGKYEGRRTLIFKHGYIALSV